MNLRGPCSSCGAQLATDQRYCVECGARVGPPMAMPYLPAATPSEAAAGRVFGFALPIPLQWATTCAALALGFGVVVGTAVTPNLAGSLAGPVVAQAPPPTEAAPTPPPASGGGAPAPAPAAPTGASLASSDDSTPTSGGGKKKKKQKDKKEYFTGTVVHLNPNAGSYILNSTTNLYAIHDDELPAVGDKLKVPIEVLSNGTSEEDGKRKNKGTEATSSFTGTVSFVEPTPDPLVYNDPDPADDVYAVSSLGATVLVHAPDPTGTSSPPPVGSVVTVNADIIDRPAPVGPPVTQPAQRDFCGQPAPAALPSPPIVSAKILRQVSVNVDITNVDSAQIESVVQAVCPGTGELLIAADDTRESEQSLVVKVAPGIDLTRIAPGQSLVANGAIGDAPTQPNPVPNPPLKVLLTLTGVANDTGKEGADDSTSAQGDFATQ